MTIGEERSKMSINPIFREPVPDSPNKPLLNKPNLKPEVPAELPAPQPRQRKTRSDKTHDMRISVSLNQKALIRRLAKESNMTPTKYATKMLLSALSTCRSLPEYDYRDTKIYVHVKPAQLDYQKVFEFAVANDVSEREAATRLVMHVFRQRGGFA